MAAVLKSVPTTKNSRSRVPDMKVPNSDGLLITPGIHGLQLRLFNKPLK